MQRIAVKKSATYPGLCASCDKQQACTYPRGHARPVFQCLEFEELSEVETPHNGHGGFTPGARVHAVPERLEPGLCADCDGRDGCTYPRMPGGVWFCEEYR